MKTLLFLLSILLVCSGFSLAQSGWVLQPSFTSSNLYDCKPSALGNLYLGSDNGKVYRSSSGGVSWSIYNFNDALLSTSSIKFVVGQSNDNWAFVGDGNAFGYVYSPMDTVMRIPVAPSVNLEALASLSGYFFYTASSAAGTGGNFYIQDGPSWRKDTAATRLAAGKNINYSSRNIFVGDNGLIMKADSIGLPHSNGEGIKWRVIPSGTTKNIYSVQANSGYTYMAVGEDGLILRTTDMGETWTKIPSPTTEDLYHVWLGYAYLICGSNGTILRSYTLDVSKWYIQPTPTTNNLYFINSLGYSEYISGGEGGVFLRTSDGGGSLKRFIGTSYIEGFYNPVSNTTITDTMSVTVRSSAPPYNIISTGKEKFNNGGYVNIELGPAVLNSVPYYIQVNHRNSLETWSKTPQVFTSNDLYYDFYNSAAMAFGDNQRQLDTSPIRFGFYAGDVDQNGSINLTDMLQVYNAASIFTSGYKVSDVNGDNLTNLTDILITYNNANNFIQKITPP